MNTNLQIFGEEHRKLVERIAGALATLRSVDFSAEKLSVQIVNCDVLPGKGECTPQDYLFNACAVRIEYIDHAAFALYVFYDKEMTKRIVVRSEDIWLPPFVPTGSLHKIVEALVAR